MDSFAKLRSCFWAETFWLPNSITWNDLKSTDQCRMARMTDLHFVVPLTLFLILIRKLFERFIACPFLKWCGLKEKAVAKAEPNEILEKVYSNLTGQLEIRQMESLASTLGWTVGKVKQWFRNKQFYNKPSKLKKSQETSWRFVFYLFTSIWGFTVLRKENYLYDTREIWKGYPNHNLSDGVLFYYLLQLSFYCGLLFSQFTDVKRKDFWIQTIHHILTISLLSGSFVANFIRVGSVVLLLHDVSDVFLEFGKVCKYLKFERASDIIFGIFAVVFFVSRLVMYPLSVLRSVVVELPVYFGTFPIYYVLSCFLFSLQAMHLYWFYLIFCMAYTFLVKGKIEHMLLTGQQLIKTYEKWLENDARSDTDDSEYDETNKRAVSNGVVNDKLKEQ